MFTKVHWLHQFDNSAKLGIMARPRGDEWLEEEIVHLKKAKVGLLLSLLETPEITELGLRKEKEICLSNSIEYANFPIVDRGIPKPGSGIELLLTQLQEKINTGISVVIHCRMGIGRSSIIAGCLLLKTGQKADDIIRHITKVRGLKVPDTEEQIEWLRKRKG